MNKKELKEKLKNIPEDKYIYQRLNGIIKKYKDDGNYYINCETGNAYEKYDNIFLGKVTENKIALVECGDYVNGWKVLAKTKTKNNEMKVCILTSFEDEHWITINNETLKTIVTKEAFKEREYVF